MVSQLYVFCLFSNMSQVERRVLFVGKEEISTLTYYFVLVIIFSVLCRYYESLLV